MSQDSVVIVTGGARGIGRATVDRLVAQGVRVVAVDQDADGLKDLETSSPGVVTIVGDVSSPSIAREAVDAARDAFGRLTGLVNNAGIGAYGLTVESTSEEEWDRVVDVDLKSVYLFSHFAIPTIRDSGGGAIVNVASVHALATQAGLAPYAAAKGGVMALTRAMAIDHAPDGIRVCAVLPGAVDTPLLRGHAAILGVKVEDWGFGFDERSFPRVGRPEEIAAVITFLLSSDASFINGSPIITDGGLLARFGS
jgi:NAD(P)-dependent dehydrogenase (short-subunit alcohol dehydrogenase family)